MTRLSVNINKIATLRNSRGGDTPSVIEAAIKAQEFGAEGITIHPRPDERHIRYQDARDLKDVVKTEFNIEGNPIKKFMDLVLEIKPEQVTLVPDSDDVLTSNAGWDTISHKEFLTEIIDEFKKNNIRTSIFLDPNPSLVEAAAETGADRIELYTEHFAVEYAKGNKEAVNIYKETADLALKNGLVLNAGHDLSLDNLQFFIEQIPEIAEVSIGHALISESIYMGLENTIQAYLKRIELAHKKEF